MRAATPEVLQAGAHNPLSAPLAAAGGLARGSVAGALQRAPCAATGTALGRQGSCGSTGALSNGSEASGAARSIAAARLGSPVALVAGGSHSACTGATSKDAGQVAAAVELGGLQATTNADGHESPSRYERWQQQREQREQQRTPPHVAGVQHETQKPSRTQRAARPAPQARLQQQQGRKQPESPSPPRRPKQAEAAASPASGNTPPALQQSLDVQADGRNRNPVGCGGGAVRDAVPVQPGAHLIAGAAITTFQWTPPPLCSLRVSRHLWQLPRAARLARACGRSADRACRALHGAMLAPSASL